MQKNLYLLDGRVLMKLEGKKFSNPDLLSIKLSFEDRYIKCKCKIFSNNRHQGIYPLTAQAQIHDTVQLPERKAKCLM